MAMYSAAASSPRAQLESEFEAAAVGLVSGAMIRSIHSSEESEKDVEERFFKGQSLLKIYSGQSLIKIVGGGCTVQSRWAVQFLLGR